MKKDTIAAIATAVSASGIGIIRISGEEAIEIADRILMLKGKEKKLSDCPTHTLHYGFIKNQDKIADEVIVLLMRTPRSYTTEDTVEIDCHGGMLVMQNILDLLLKNGARAAEPGEFTKRAFLNGRIDLAQAESVMDLIHAKNDFALKASLDQLSGLVSKEIREIRKKILHEIALIEAAIDDPEHYNLLDYGMELSLKLDSLLGEMDRLLLNAKNGAVLKEGIHTVIIGKPNSGKSSLLNMLAQKERAIVTEIAGTTRDAIEEQINFNGIHLNVIDTAGIHHTNDPVEKIGVEKAMKYIEKSDLIFYVVDITASLDEDDASIIQLIRDKNVIVLLNKSDLIPVVKEEEIKIRLDKTVLFISAKNGDGIDKLRQMVEKMFFHGKISMNDEIYLTNFRHQSYLSESRESLLLVKKSIEEQLPEDFYSIDLMNAYEKLGFILGESLEDDLTDEIFSKFCMGK